MANATVNPVSQIQAIVAARPANGGEAEGSSSFAQALEARRPASKAEPANQTQPRRNEPSRQDSTAASTNPQDQQASTAPRRQGRTSQGTGLLTGRVQRGSSDFRQMRIVPSHAAIHLRPSALP